MQGSREQVYVRAGVLVLACLASIIVSQPYLHGSPLRLAAGALLVFFLPGYAVQTVLLPSESGSGSLPRRTRLALSIGTSPAIVALVALTLTEFTGRIIFDQILTTLLLSTGLLVGIALFQSLTTRQEGSRLAAKRNWQPRRQLSERLPQPTVSGIVGTESRRQWVLVGVAAILFGGLLVIPAPQQSYTELGLLTETERGQLTADNYPETLETGASASVVATVHNKERASQEYTLVITRGGADRETVLLASQRVSLADGTGERLQTTLTAPQTPGKVRFTYRLYRPANVESVDTVTALPDPYRETRLLVSVRPAGSTDGESR